MQKLFFPMISITVTVLISMSQFAQAAKNKPTAQEYFNQVNKIAPYDSSWKAHFPKPSKAQIEKSAKAMKGQESSRQVASDKHPTMDQEFFENKMSPAMKKFRAEFLMLKTPDQLDSYLIYMDKNYDTFPADLKFVAAQLIPLRSMRGIVWRLIPTVEDTKIVHSFVLTMVKNMAVNMNLLLPTEQWQAGFDYLTQPFVENGDFPFTNAGKVVAAFPRGNESAVQAHIRNAIVPMLRTSAHRIEELDLSTTLSAWDNKLLYGVGSFPSAIDRYSLFGEVERHGALTNTYSLLSELCFLSAFSMQGQLALTQDLGKLYGFDGFFSKIDGAPASKRVEVMIKPEYANWGVRFSDYKQWTEDSWEFLTRSIDHGDQMWQAMKNRPVSEVFMLNNTYALPFQRPIANRFENLNRLKNGKTEIPSFITDERVTVNLKEFYINPPNDLKKLYAYEFDESEEKLKINLTVNGKVEAVEYRNYLRGRPAKWRLDVYQPYFPNIKTDADLKSAVRILSQGWGTSTIAVPMLNYMN